MDFVGFRKTNNFKKLRRTHFQARVLHSVGCNINLINRQHGIRKLSNFAVVFSIFSAKSRFFTAKQGLKFKNS